MPPGLEGLGHAANVTDNSKFDGDKSSVANPKDVQKPAIMDETSLASPTRMPLKPESKKSDPPQVDPPLTSKAAGKQSEKQSAALRVPAGLTWAKFDADPKTATVNAAAANIAHNAAIIVAQVELAQAELDSDREGEESTTPSKSKIRAAEAKESTMSSSRQVGGVKSPVTSQLPPLATPVKTPWQTISSEHEVSAPAAPIAGAALGPTPSEATKRQPSNKVDVPQAQRHQAPFAAVAKNGIPDAPSRTQSPGTPSISRPVSPGSIVDASSKKRAHTIRVVATPKQETAPVMTFPTAVTKIPSRNPSITSAQLPGTPVSEHISDTVSLTSTSVSRPASPPPGGIVGSAAVRNKTKSQLKKERQERAKVMEEERKQGPDGASPSIDEPVQEAIASRKKKAKKPSTAPRPTPQVEPAAARAVTDPASVDADPTDKEKAAVEADADSDATWSAPSSPRPEEKTPNSIINELRAGSKLFSSCLETFLRPLSQANLAYKPTTAITTGDVPLDRPFKRYPDLNLGPEQVRQLQAQEPLKYGGEEARVWSHGCITPGGAHLRHLEQDLEERYLTLEKAENARPRELRYHYFPVSDRSAGPHLDEDTLPRVDLEALRWMGAETGSGASSRPRDNNAMEKAVEEGSKKGSFLVGNAEGYINEFVMPVPGGARSIHNNVGGPPSGTTALTNQDGGAIAGKNLEELEKLLSQAKKDAEEKEAHLRKVIKKNRKFTGFTH